jgi:hypothetical protein
MTAGIITGFQSNSNGIETTAFQYFAKKLVKINDVPGY